MSPHPDSERQGRRRVARASALAALCLAALACRAEGERHDLDLALAARALPGTGASLALAQVLSAGPTRHLDFELGLERQELSKDGPNGNDWSRVFGGLRSAPWSGSGLEWGGGITWIRSDAENDALEDPGDYGGAYLDGRYAFALTPRLSTGPGLTLFFVDSEGDHSGSGAGLQLAWTWTAHL